MLRKMKVTLALAGSASQILAKKGMTQKPCPRTDTKFYDMYGRQIWILHHPWSCSRASSGVARRSNISDASTVLMPNSFHCRAVSGSTKL